MSRVRVGAFAFSAASWAFCGAISLALHQTGQLIFDMALVALFLFLTVVSADT